MAKDKKKKRKRFNYPTPDNPKPPATHYEDRQPVTHAPVIEAMGGAVAGPGKRSGSTASAGGGRALPFSQDGRRGLMGGRITMDRDATPFDRLTVVVPPTSAEQTWRQLALDDKALDRMSVTRLIELLCDLSPDISKAVWDYQRMINPGFVCEARSISSPEKIDEKANKALQEFINYLNDEYGSFDVVVNRLSIAGYIRGALLAELVLDKAGRTPIDFVTPDPAIIRFKRIPDPDRGVRWEMGQYQMGRWVAFNRPTVRYIPIDPYPDKPYGRPLVAPALFSTLFLLGLLHDLRRVVAQQGYPRIDIVVNLEALRKLIPDDQEGDTVEFADTVRQAIAEVKTIYSKLEPDDAYVHNDAIEVKRPVGTVDSDSLGAIEGLIKALERMSVRALKTMPLLMGTTDGVSEANANRQYEIFVQGVKSIQHLLETLLERLLTLALQAQGIAAKVHFRFSENRAAEAMRDAQTKQTEISNEKSMYEMGYTSLDEGAERLTGHKAVEEKPRGVIGAYATAPDASDVEPEPGSNRAVIRIRTKKGVIRVTGVRELETVDPKGAEAGLTPVPSTVEVSDTEFNRYIREWESEQPASYDGLLDCEVVTGAED